MPISPGRRIAFEILIRVEQAGAFASDLLHARLNESVSARDAALATELVMGALRWQRELDFFIERYASKQTAAWDSEVVIALRLGIYQLRHLARVPAHAAVSDSVELVKAARKKSAAALVNAVLRRAAQEKTKSLTSFLPAETSLVERLAISNSHPTWLVERWLPRFGEQAASALLASNNQPPGTACRIVDPSKRDQALRSLDDSGIEFSPGVLSRDAILIRRGNIAKTDAFQSRWLAIQDEASQLIPLLLEAHRGDSLLDLCAAPGGKTLALALAAGPHALIVAADLHPHRLRAMRERWQASVRAPIHFVALDGTQPLPFSKKFNRILLDAPCTGTGTLSRNPEIRWRLMPGDLAEFHRRQVALLRSALEHLAPGGRLLYSTCSLEPEENEDVLAAFLSAHPEFRQVRAQLPTAALASGITPDQLIGSDGAFRTFPPRHHADGFFAAAIERR
jgi:16S rRNA (cytosine967-C5)-methyltransferase